MSRKAHLAVGTATDALMQIKDLALCAPVSDVIVACRAVEKDRLLGNWSGRREFEPSTPTLAKQCSCARR
jgi:hypothetical protein